ncbi:unnamed protein product (macronuclear) [Paramecium tetraurelia]|uniref:Uncharacterized protein n=1 Tax=Paramecium tetraurelia TaxID=5888 RepID=A0E510_PARTE|nr:uncharacterized protein GSPATT00023554001 [Paramecium tetraurelia]CAK90377.1 unnamed protein product [Paramecium tetraurelia]|eukprot:XP_001457774.1 hypothetical protein (macronuclear) [Paramecium tetraurelia strain d4-2]
MSRGNELDDLLFKRRDQNSKQGEDLKQIIENIPYPHADITITSYSEFSDNTPQKYLHKLVHTENTEVQPQKFRRHRSLVGDAFATDSEVEQRELKSQKVDQKRKPLQQQPINQQEIKPPLVPQQQQQLQDFYASGGSYLESMTPQRMNKIVDWSKQHVTPGDAKNIFPQVIAPSIEFSNENSLSLQFKNVDPEPKKPQILSHQNQNNQNSRLENRIWEKQKRYMESEIQGMKKQQRKLENENLVLAQKLEEQEEITKLLQEKHKDYSCLEILRGKYLEVAKQQMKQLKQQLELKDQKLKDLNEQTKGMIENEKRMQEAIELELRELHAQLDIKDQMVRALKNQQNNEDNERQKALQEYEKTMSDGNKFISKLKSQIETQMKALEEKESIITSQDAQIQNLQVRLLKEAEYRKQDEKVINEFKSKEALLYQQVTGNTMPEVHNRAMEELQAECINQKILISQLQSQLTQQMQMHQLQHMTSNSYKECEQCKLCKDELANIIQECSLEEEAKTIDATQSIAQIAREVVTLLLTKQREQIDHAFLQYEEQIKEQAQQIDYFKEQNDEVMQENQKISDQIQIVLEKKEEQEQQIFEEYEKLRQINQNLLSENKTLKLELEQHKQQLRNETQAHSNEIQQLKHEIQINKQSLLQAKQNESKLVVQQQSQLKCEEKILINQEMENMKIVFQNQIQELYNKLHNQDEQIQELTKELYTKKKQIDEMQQQQSSIKKQRKEKEQKESKEQTQLKTYAQQLSDLNDEKSKLLQKIQHLEQQQTYQTKRLDEEKHDKLEKLNQQIKEKDKKNIDLYNQNRTLQTLQKELDDQISSMKDEIEKQKKQIQLKNSEIKQLLEQNKQLQDKNQEINNRLSILQQQMNQFENEIKHYEQSPQIPEKLRSQASVRSFDKTPHAVIELVEGFNQYQQEFYHLKKMFTEKLKAQEQNLLSLQQTNQQITQQNLKLIQENNALKDEISSASHGKNYEDRGSAQTGDSLNIRSFLDQDHKKTLPCKSPEQHFSIVELVQPEIMSIEDTIMIFKEILRRSVKSVEMIKMICPLPEIKELLMIILQVEEKMQQQSQVTANKKSKIINSILGASNIKLIDQSRKKSACGGMRVKQSHRSETGVIEFYE